jgi:hypothetical protein
MPRTLKCMPLSDAGVKVDVQLATAGLCRLS